MVTLPYQMIIPALLVVLATGLGVHMAHAQTTTDEIAQSTTTSSDERAATREERQETRGDRLEELQTERSERQAARASATADRIETREEQQAERQTQVDERRAQLTERAQERITNLAANISNRIDAAIERLQNITERFESRRDTINDRGIATPAADQSLTDATASLAQARATMDDIDEAVATVTGSENPREAWPAVRAKYQAAVTDIRTTRQHLREVLAGLKAAITNSAPAAPDVEASTSTDEVTE